MVATVVLCKLSSQYIGATAFLLLPYIEDRSIDMRPEAKALEFSMTQSSMPTAIRSHMASADFDADAMEPAYAI